MIIVVTLTLSLHFNGLNQDLNDRCIPLLDLLTQVLSDCQVLESID